MQKIRITKHVMPDKHWLVYADENGAIKHVDLSGCANTFSRVTCYTSCDGFKAVGLRYEENDQLCYELFNIGHTVLFAPLQPNPIQLIGYLLRGKNPKKAHEEYLAAFEAALNRGGWKTVERKEVAL